MQNREIECQFCKKKFFCRKLKYFQIVYNENDEEGYTGYNGHANQKSTGIGLYLCSTILKKLGHSFTITSQEGTGTRVMIGFPEES